MNTTMTGMEKGTESHPRGWTGKIIVKYALLQIPGLLSLILILFVIEYWVKIPLWLVSSVVVFSVIKDIILFPFVWTAYDNRSYDANLKMIGQKGVAQEVLDPRGYVQVRGELWRAEIAEGCQPIQKGASLKVKEIRGLNLIVEEEEK